MNRLSINRRELVHAVAATAHAGFENLRWQWQVAVNPKADHPQASVVLVDPDVTPDAGYVLVNEETYSPLEFADLNGFTWGDAGDLAGVDNIKDLEQLQPDNAVLEQVTRSLRKHVQLGNETFGVDYF